MCGHVWLWRSGNFDGYTLAVRCSSLLSWCCGVVPPRQPAPDRFGFFPHAR